MGKKRKESPLARLGKKLMKRCKKEGCKVCKRATS